MSSRELKIRYAGDISGVRNALAGLEQAHTSFADKMKAIGSKMRSVGTSLTAGLTLPIVGFGAAAVSAFTDAQKVMAQTKAALQSTGGAAGVTARDIANLANEIMGYSGMSDEAIQSTENLLLTFTKIQNSAGEGNDIFTQATKIAADMSTALGQDLKSSAIQLGKALNDPIKGITALSRVGVTFTDAQREQIAAMVEAGDVMGAQKVILAELTTEFGGSAQAAGETVAGQFDIMKERVGNAMEAIGKAILTVAGPVLEKIASAVQGALQWFNNLSPSAKRLGIVIAGVAAAAGPLLIVFGSPVGLVVAAIVAIAAGFVLAYNKSEAFRNFVQGVVEWFSTSFIPGLQSVVDWLVATFGPVFAQIGETIRAVLNGLASFWREWGDRIKAIIEVAVNFWKNLIKAGIDFVAGIIRTVLAIIRGDWGAAWDGIKQAVGAVWDAIRNIVSTAIHAVKEVVLTVARALRDALSAAWDAITSAASGAWGAIKTVAVRVWNGIAGAIKAAVNIAIGAINALIRGMNRMSGALDFVAGPWVNWGDIPQIPPLLARGGRIRRPGLAIVGEAGPELLSLPRGAQVTPLSAAGVGGLTVVVNVAHLVGSERELARLIRDEFVALGRRNVTNGLESA